MNVHDFQPHREQAQENDPMNLAATRPAPLTPQRSVSVLGWGLALGGGAAIWGLIFALVR